MITKPAGTPMTEPQFSYLIGLIEKVFAGDAAGRTKALVEAAGFDFNGASAKIDLYKAAAQGAPAAVATVAAVQQVLGYEPPAGHYYVDGQHVWVKKGKYGGAKILEVAGKWVGSLLHQKAIAWVNEHLGTEDKAYACVLEYAKVTHKCGVCNTKLTDPKSIAAGIGPVCAKKYGKSI
jgi:hypothetical protein